MRVHAGFGFVCRYGALNRVEIKRNYAFVEFKNLDEAIEAQKRTHGTNFDGRTITVEFVESSRLGRDRCVLVCLCQHRNTCMTAQTHPPCTAELPFPAASLQSQDSLVWGVHGMSWWWRLCLRALAAGENQLLVRVASQCSMPAFPLLNII